MNSITPRTLLATSIALALGTPVANAAAVNDVFGPYTWSTDRANFTMLSPVTTSPVAGVGGSIIFGTNDILMSWDGNGFSSDTDYTGPGSVANVTASSTQPLSASLWTVHDIQVFVPGTYSFDTTLGGGNGEAGTLTATVGAGQLGMHMLFDWGGSLNMDFFVVASQSQVFGSGVGAPNLGTACTYSNLNCLWTGKGWAGGVQANAPTGGQTWMLASIDGNGDGVPGIPNVAGGPFQFFHPNFNANLTPTPKVPVPAAVWLFGSGLLGLLGVGRRRSKR